MPKLDKSLLRTDLTIRECATLLGSLIGGLVQMAPIENIRVALAWWARTDVAWDMLKRMKEQEDR